MKKSKIERIKLHEEHIKKLIKKIEYHKKQIEKLKTEPSNYQLLLKNEKWKEKRKEILNEQGEKCSECGCRTNLQIHHIYYQENKLPWEYPNNAFMVLCKNCHQKKHGL
jgi:5-methylcytosine-specific restriction endonuclease McrA